ncbi:MAG: helix-turn-helix domain-containing protein [Deltaproteobacteria bacterium]|jgi:hypothetical protein|nr:helix-turn-helix domain-containing protein [Deltaproteobacteria bacterium]
MVVYCNEDGSLIGLKEIAAYMQLDARTVVALVQKDGFPAAKINGYWMADRSQIGDWLRAKVQSCLSSANKGK